MKLQIQDAGLPKAQLSASTAPKSVIAKIVGSAEGMIAIALLSVVLIVGGTAAVLQMREEPQATAPAPPVQTPAAADALSADDAPVETVEWAEELEGEVAVLEQSRKAEAPAPTPTPVIVARPATRAPVNAAAARPVAPAVAVAVKPTAAPAVKPPPAATVAMIKPPTAIAPSKDANLVRAKLDWSSCSQPKYPRDSLRNSEEGAVVMAFQIDKTGTVIDKRVDQKSGSPRLDSAALNAIAKCRFSPATVSGAAAESWTKVKFVWKLKQ